MASAAEWRRPSLSSRRTGLQNGSTTCGSRIREAACRLAGRAARAYGGPEDAWHSSPARNMKLSLVMNTRTLPAVWLLGSFACHKQQPPPPPPPAVQVTEVVQSDVPIYREWVGSLDGLVNADIRPQV